MLSKLEFFESNTGQPERPVEHNALQIAIEKHLHAFGGTGRIEPATEGTLGVCFHADIAGTRRFVKTHMSAAQARANLTKEADILLRLYGDAVIIDRFEVQAADGTNRLCLVMAELAPLRAPMNADEAEELARGNIERLTGYRPASLAPSWDFERYIACGLRAVVLLSDAGLLENYVGAELNQILVGLSYKLGALPRALCHGDFGPKNILRDGARPIAIDWEDAFWGVAGYDYLYWLTFMDNRPFLHSAAFGRTGLHRDDERAILALVVLLKSFLAFRSGAYLRHAVSINARTAEVLDLP